MLPVILMYHSVAIVNCDPFELAVSPKHFEEQIAYLRKHRTVLPLDDFVRKHAQAELVSDAVAITFDDGYQDNLLEALLILRKYDAPSTLFVATAYAGQERPFWWDELAFLIIESPHAARQYEECGDEQFLLEWGPSLGAHRSTEFLEPDEIQMARGATYERLWMKLKFMKPRERERVMQSIRLKCQPSTCPGPRPLTISEIKELLSDDLIALGAHTHTHPSLTAMSPEIAREEIALGQRCCQQLAGKPTNGFAYPCGDVNVSVRGLVEEAGFKWSCSTRKDFVRPGADVFDLPRIATRNRPPGYFVERLSD